MRRVLLVTVALVACSGDREDPAPVPAPTPCDELSAPTAEGGCARTGVEACGDGFVPERGGCRAVLPESCAAGTIAVPGDEECRPIATCADGPWAGVPRGGTVLFVRAGATGGDGTEARPFARIGEAVAAAPSGALIAIDDGAYDEDVVLERPAKLWGRCPSTVLIRGVSLPAAIEARSDLELHRLSVRGPGVGVWISGSPRALIDEVWIHDCGARGIEVAGYGKRSLTTVSRTLIERVRASGIGAFGAEVTIDASAIRDVSPRPGNPQTGDGVLMRPEKNGVVPGSLTITGSTIERTRLSGITLSGVPGTVERTLVRDVQPLETKTHGLGVYCGMDPPTTRPAAPVTLRNVVIERVHSVGVQLAAAEGLLEGVTIRDVAPELLTGEFGYGLQASRAPVTIDSIAVERAHGGGICVHGSVATITRAWVSETLAEANARFGDGIVVTGDEDEPTRATSLALSRSRVQKSARAGVSVFGSTMTLGSSDLSCNAIDLHVGGRIGFTESGAPIDAPFSLVDAAGNRCGCGAIEKCAARSENLEPLRAR